MLKRAQNTIEEDGRRIRIYFSWKLDDCPPEVNVGKAFSLCVYSSEEMLWNLSFFVGVHNDNNSWLCFTQSQAIC